MLSLQALVAVEYSLMAKVTVLVVLPVWQVTLFYDTVILVVIVNNRIYGSLLYSNLYC